MEKLINWFDNKKIAVLSAMLFILSLIPILYLAQYARPSGDDYNYGVLTHIAWLETHSLIEVFKAGIKTVKQMYSGWNGNWFTVFLFSFMPEVFAPYTFVVVPYIMVGALTFGTAAFLYYIIVKICGFSREYAVIVSVLLLFVSFQFIPSTAIGMYWFVGATQYIIPHMLALLALTFGVRYYNTNKIRNIVYASIFMFMVGGSSYFSSLLVFMVYIAMIIVFVRKRKDILWLLLPFGIGAVGFIIQCISPGNKVRAGDDFGFYFSDAIFTIIESLRQGVTGIFKYFKDKPFIYMALFICALFMWEAILKMKKKVKFCYPLLAVIFLFGIYSAMYAPKIYSGVAVSLGPDTIIYFTFLITALLTIIYVEGWTIQKLRKRDNHDFINNYLLNETSYRNKVLIPALAICIIITFINHGWFRNSVDKRVYDYVHSGQAEDFRDQIQSQMDILLDVSIKEAYLVPINDNQGPLMHMPVTTDPDNFTNRVVKDFYQKEKVVMIEP